jgi:hypothetical protein
MNARDLNEVFDHYVIAALWASIDDDGTPLDSNHDADDIDIRSQAEMFTDVKDFVEGCEAERPDIFDGMDPGQIGHDFLLTRDHHGTGFWDRGLGEVGDFLTKASDPYGDSGLYVGDDGKIYV